VSTSIHELLSRLEDVSTEAVRITDPALNTTVDTVAALDKITERGQLVQQLNTELDAAGLLSYADFNRLVVIHYQGSRADENLKLTRSQLAGELSANTRERAFLDCLTGGLETPRTTCLSDNA
jgi:hypothetical protein